MREAVELMAWSVASTGTEGQREERFAGMATGWENLTVGIRLCPVNYKRDICITSFAALSSNSR